MNHDHYSDHAIRSILNGVKRIAMVGASANTVRPSYFALKYLMERGYDMRPVNPGQAGGSVLGLEWYARLADVPGPIDMVDVFRGVDALPGVLDEVLALDPLPRVLWLQLGIRDDAIAARAEAHGIEVIMNRCPKI
ncbi:MAG: CoA-binding protein, partial [Hyphomicrobiaceae bacterium]|nr:CoA-binding protein [Hyphomicrobiaceae bacterium]